MTMHPESSQAKIDGEAAFWCLTLAEDQLDTEDQRAFDTWIAAPEHATAFEDALRVWGAADQAINLPEVIRVRAGSLDHLHRVQRARWTRRIPIGDLRRWRWPAAAIAASIVFALIGFALLHDPTTIYRTGVGERRVAMLADGSRVSLDADTEIGVRLRRDRRELFLHHGRAKFDVARDPLRPFSVTAGDKVVVATGTSFSVELLRRQARVLLYEGHVAVLDRKDDKPVAVPAPRGAVAAPADFLLTPGHELVLSIDVPVAKLVIQPVDLGRSRSWEGGQLEFEDELLQTAVQRMNRYSTRQIVLGDASMARQRINGVFDAGNIDAFVEAITLRGDVKVLNQQGEVVLRRD
jgi:transmembrane sensor